MGERGAVMGRVGCGGPHVPPCSVKTVCIGPGGVEDPALLVVCLL